MPAASAIVTISGAEHADVASYVGPRGPAVSNTGLLVPVNPDVRAEPHSALAEHDYVLVLCPAETDDETRPAQLARLLALHFPQRVVAVVHDDTVRSSGADARRKDSIP